MRLNVTRFVNEDFPEFIIRKRDKKTVFIGIENHPNCSIVEPCSIVVNTDKLSEICSVLDAKERVQYNLREICSRELIMFDKRGYWLYIRAFENGAYQEFIVKYDKFRKKLNKYIAKRNRKC